MNDTEQIEHFTMVSEIAGVAVDNITLPADGNLIANGIRLHYLDWGPPDAPALVFLHGGNLSAHTWDLVCLSLNGRYRSIAIDMRGHGDSEWPAGAEYNLADFSADLDGVLTSLDVRNPALIGMSLGGLTALKYAGEFSDRLAGLVLVDVGPRLNVDGARAIVDFVTGDHELDNVEAFVERAVAFNPNRRRELLRRSLLHNLRQMSNGRWSWKWDHRRMMNVDLDEMLHEHAELWNSVPQVSCPVLVVRGEHSNVLLPDDAAELTAAFPNATFVEVAAAGHTVQGDNPRGLLDALDPFLASIQDTIGTVGSTQPVGKPARPDTTT